MSYNSLLPRELLPSIANYSSVTDYLALSATSSHYYSLIKGEEWEKFLYRDLSKRYQTLLKPENISWFQTYKFLVTTNTHILSLALVGDRGTGKSSYLRRCKNGSFSENYLSTSSLEMFTLSLNTNKGKVLVQIYDYPPNVQPASYHGMVALFKLPEAQVMKIEGYSGPVIHCWNKYDEPRIGIYLKNNHEHITKDFPPPIYPHNGSKSEMSIWLDSVRERSMYGPLLTLSCKNYHNNDKPVARIVRHYLGKDVMIHNW